MIGCNGKAELGKRHRSQALTGRLLAGIVAFAALAGPGRAEENTPNIPLPEEIGALIEDSLKANTAPVVLPLPEDLSDTVRQALADEARRLESTTSSVSAPAALAFDIPLPPEVVVSFDLPRKVEIQPVALGLEEEKLRALLEPAKQKFRLTQGQIDAIVETYLARGGRALWIEAGIEGARLSARAEALKTALSHADRDGLDPARLLSVLATSRDGSVPTEKQAETDIGFSLAAFLYAHDARGGRIEPARVSALLTPQLAIPSPREVLERVSVAEPAKLGAVLEMYQPPHAGYRALRKALAKLREEMAAPVLAGAVAGVEGAPHPSGILPAHWLEGAPLAFDKPDPRVPHLRQRLALASTGSNIYDAETREAVIRFQRANDLTPNARITPKTRAALQNPRSPLTEADRKPDKQALLSALLVNMERWRWLPADLGETHVFVNIAEYRLNLVSKNASIHETRVIVGKPQTQTPVFSDEIEHLIVNPSWHVPPSILKKEFLPNLAKDPEYAARRGYEVIRRGNSISIRQPPGERNALGNVKFIFPNQHSVYLHDTPTRNLFSAEQRAFSHGCVRVDKPFAFAEKLLQADLGLSEQQLRAMVGRGERMLKLSRKIPVHLAYFTISANEAGEIMQRRDFYGHDGRLASALRF
ncbi:MAG: L,D-transpeptidase family protein [Proteobacteria bacterium]|nr:L,D-transpeptidase family protein [Pseudomonadota bacterium]